MLKKASVFILMVTLLFTVVSCGGGGEKPDSSNVESQASYESGESNVSSVDESSTNESEASNTSEQETSKPQSVSKFTSSSGQSSSLASAPTTSAPGGSNVEMVNPVSIKQGKTPVDANLNFGGKTFTMAITQESFYHTSSFTRMKTAFETKYKCKIELHQLVFETYNQQVTQRISAGSTYDICFSHGSMFPSNVISNLYEDLSSVITTADYFNSSNPVAGGVDIAKSSYFAYKGKLYGIATFSSLNPIVIYYNKALFKSSGLEDPLELYNDGKWTWSKIRSMGREVINADKDIYFLNGYFKTWGTIGAFGKMPYGMKNSKPEEYLSTENVMNGLNMIKTLFASSNPIGKAAENFYDGSAVDAFIKGSRFMHQEETHKYVELAAEVKKSTAFQRNKDNLGIVPLPLDSKNTEKNYPCGWMWATCAGKGTKDVRAAVAWAKFKQSYKDPIKNPDDMTDAQKALENKLRGGNICFLHGNYATSSYDTLQMIRNMAAEVAGGADVSQTVANLRPQFKAAFEATIK